MSVTFSPLFLPRMSLSKHCMQLSAFGSVLRMKYVFSFSWNHQHEVNMNASKSIDSYRLTSALLSPQDSSLLWFKCKHWRSVSGPGTMPQTSSSDELDAPSQRSQSFSDAFDYAHFLTRYLFMYASGIYVHFLFAITDYKGLNGAAWLFNQA